MFQICFSHCFLKVHEMSFLPPTTIFIIKIKDNKKSFFLPLICLFLTLKCLDLTTDTP